VTGDELSVENLDVIRAPGFDTTGLPVEEFSSGINVIHGPNASGKTTLARSLQWLLWPEDIAGRISLSGQVRLNGESWRVDVDPGRTQYQRNGESTNGPNLPPTDQRDRYYLALHDLLQEDTRNESFAQRIKRESAGGFDLTAAHEALDFSESPSTRGKKVVNKVEKDLAEWREAKREVRELREEEQRLSRLRRELKEARKARERVEVLDQAIEYAEGKAELEAAEAEVEEFPDEVAKLDGDEADEVEEIDATIAQLGDKKENAEVRIGEANKELSEADLPDEGISESTITKLKERTDDLDDLESKKEDLRAELSEARGQRENVLSDLPLEVDEEDFEELEPDVWEEASAFARDAERVRAEREIQTQVDQWLRDDERPEPAPSTLKRGRSALENWLASPEEETTASAFRIAAISAVLLAGAGTLLGIFLHPALLLFAVAGLALAWYGYTTRSKDGSQSARKTYRNEFENLSLEPPSSWSEGAVRDLLNDIYDDIAAHTLAEQQLQRWETLSKDVGELQEKEESLAEKRAELQKSLGAAPETTDVEIFAIANCIRRWQEAHDRVVGCERELETVTRQIAEKKQELRSDLESYGYEEVSDAAQTTAHIRDLESRKSKHEEAKRAIQGAEKTIEEMKDEISELEAKRKSLFSKAELSPGEVGPLREFCEQVEDYQEAVDRRDNAKHLKNKEEGDLMASPGFEPGLKERDIAELRSEKAELEAVAEEYDEIHADINQIVSRIEQAKESNDVEEALAEKERALHALAEQLTSDYEAMVGDVLTDHVREATLQTSRPEVFQRASDILARFTKGRYDLLLDDDADTFRAYDTVKERGFDLDDLSSGTRLQVLLAVRVAFVEQQEQGVQLPLILDETLANSDDEKAEIIVESMIELARDGRQVFYFTAQGDEVARWIAALEDVDDVDHAVIDLDDVHDHPGRVEVPSLDELADRSQSPPDPDGHDHESYGEQLDVWEFDPRRGAGQAHLWYVVEDVELLHRLLELGIERWGQFENLLEHTGGEAIPDDPEALQAVRRNGNALEAFVEAWQAGRGKPVDRQALEETSAVSESFIEEVSELAQRHNGDGEAIIQSLRDGEVDFFRANKIDELEQYFEEEGYIEPVETLTPEAIRMRVIKSLHANGVSRDEALEKAESLISRLSARSPAKETTS